MALTRLGKTYRHIDRYRQIVSVVVKHGFGDLLQRMHLDRYVELGLKLVGKSHSDENEIHTPAQRARRILEELGPSFVKLGQLLSTRPDLLPVEYVSELGLLQEQVPPFDPDEAVRTIEEELERPLDELFAEFEREPIASASLAQVHAARLADGTEVVVKVQRPSIEDTLGVDLEILAHLTGLLERRGDGWERYRPTRVVEELARTVRDELDYRLERAHMERFARLYADDDTVHVPRVHRSLSTARVLTIERVRGVRPDAPEKLTAAGLDPALVARRGTQAILGQLFRHGFFHADPHPGNLRVLPGNVICFLDYGMTGRLSLSQREAFADLVTAIAKSDADATTAALLHLTDYDDEPDLDRLGRDVERFIDRNVGPTLSELRLGSMLMELLEILGRHELVVPPSLFLTFKVLISIEGTGRRLDPGFNVTGEVEPFLARVQRDRLRPRRLAEEAAGAGSKWLSLLRALPGELRGLVAQARRGSLRLEFEHRRLEPLIESNERISNRLSFAIVLAALIIGSALIFHADLPPRWGEVPIVGLLGFAFAGVMGFWLLLSILRHGRM